MDREPSSEYSDPAVDSALEKNGKNTTNSAPISRTRKEKKVLSKI